MIVQHTDKECKTKFSIGVEFKNSLYVLLFYCNFLLLFYTVCTRMKFHTRTILYKGTVKLFYIDYLISVSERIFSKNTI